MWDADTFQRGIVSLPGWLAEMLCSASDRLLASHFVTRTPPAVSF